MSRSNQNIDIISFNLQLTTPAHYHDHHKTNITLFLPSEKMMNVTRY